jgi:multimeric flavodoxin WrbA
MNAAEKIYYVITASPNADGLTAACGRAALNGIEQIGKTGEIADLSAMKIQPCLVCGDGWGECLHKHRCIIADGFSALQKKLKTAEGIVLVTPVYWWQPSERMKYFCDRLRRCEALKGEGSILHGKKINIVAAAGGTGNGTVTCLEYLEQWCRHLGAVPFERLGVTRFNKDAMLGVIERVSRELVVSISASLD